MFCGLIMKIYKINIVKLNNGKLSRVIEDKIFCFNCRFYIEGG